MSKLLTPLRLISSTAPAPCPEWCVLPETHVIDVEPDRDGLRYVRHTGPVLTEAGGRTLDLEQTVVLDASGAVVEQEPARIVVDGDGLHGLDVEQARHLSAALALAAELATGGVR